MPSIFDDPVTLFDDPTDIFDGPLAGQQYFTPPLVTDNPPFLPDSTPMQVGLFRHYTPRVRGVNVFKLSDGTYVQDTATAENQNTNIPYPIDPNWAMGPGVFSYTYDNTSRQITTSANNPYVTTWYYGSHTYLVSIAEAAALEAAGYGDCLH